MARKWYLLLYLLIIESAHRLGANGKTSIARGANDTIANIIRVLREGEKTFTCGDSPDVILVLGNTGSGKSTLTTYVAGNNDALISVETPPGSDEYIFKDVRDNKICNSTINSCTLLPELTVDPVTGSAFYDCPGFSDTRSVAYDIGATYFINKLIVSANRAKIVCVVSYSSVRSGGDRQDFLLLTKNMVTMIPEITKFKESLSLVVTKVDNDYVKRGRKLVLKEDNVVIKNVANFLTSVRADLVDRLSRGGISTPEHQEYQTGIEFVDILLTKQGSSYSRIALFRRPEEAGPVSEIADYQVRKFALRSMILDKTKYTPVFPNNFKYVLADKWKVQLQGLSGEMNNLIISEFKAIADHILKAHQDKLMASLKQGDDFDNIMVAAAALSEHFNSLKNSDESLGIVQLIAEIVEVCQKAKLTIQKRYTVNATNLGQYVEFVSSVAGIRLFRAESLKDSLTDVAGYFSGVQRWYGFLKLLHSTLQTYSVQGNVERYTEKAKNVQSQIRVTSTTKTFGRTESFVALREIVNNATLDAREPELIKLYDEVEDVKLDEGKIASLNSIITINLLNHFDFRCDKDRLIVRGYILRTKDVIGGLKSCGGKLGFVDVFAARKIYIDGDIDVTGMDIQLSILSPKWEVIGDRKFKMDGLPGSDHKDKPGLFNRDCGQNGKPGGAGGPGGVFFGVGQVCLKCDKLQISNNGGAGGHGEDGGDGRKGADGEKPQPKNRDGANCRKGDYFPVMSGPVTLGETFTYYCSLDGRPGQEGGSGGRAGVGGKGGYHGDHKTIFLEPSSPRFTSNNGMNGTNGSPGRKGDDGNPGYNVKFETNGGYFPEGEPWHLTYAAKALTPSTSPDPTNYTPEEPKQPLPLRDLSMIVNRYKRFARELLQPSIDADLIKILKNLENDTDITALYDTEGLINDLQCLEDQIYSQQSSIPLLPWYTHLLVRIRQYASDRLNLKKNDFKESKIALSYLYTATLSKICSLGNPWIGGSDWVINVVGFLEIAESQIQKLGTFENVVEKSEVISTYKEGIYSKIKEALNLIQEHVVPDLKDSVTETDSNINKLVGEVLALENLAEREEDTLMKIKEELVEQLTSKRILGTLQIVTSLVGFLAPVGELIGTIAEPLLSDPGDPHNLVTPLPRGVENGLEKMREQFNDEKLFFSEQLMDLQNKFDSYSGDHRSQGVWKVMAFVESKLSEVMAKMKEKAQKKTEFVLGSNDTVAQGRQELKDAMEKAKQDLEKERPNDNGRAIKLLGYAKRVIKIGIAGKEVYDLIKNSDDDLEKMDEAIEFVHQKLDNLRGYEQVIFGIVRPLCEDIYTKVQLMVNNSEDKSRAVLIVQEWNVQKALKDVSGQLSEMTEGFKAQRPLMQCMERMSYALSSMTQLYDLIQTYYQQVQLADYIGVISQNHDNLPVKNPRLKSAIDELRVTIQSNLVLSEYEMARNGIRQFVFPFAKKYLEQFTRPPQLTMNMDIKYFVHDVAYQVTRVKEILKRDKNVLAQLQDARVFLQVKFNREGDLKTPFFTWNHHHYSRDINKLLSGQEVVLIADITKGVDQNSIKFDRIGLEFRFSNQQVQKEFDEVIKSFDVTMTHLGQSHYRCGQKIYVIDHTAEPIVHSMLTDNEGEYTLMNSIYMKVTNNYPLFSPYTAWKIQLNTNTANLKLLNRFKYQEADLDLVGRGLFIDHQIDDFVCGYDLDNFYALSGYISRNQEEETSVQNSAAIMTNSDEVYEKFLNESTGIE